MEAGERLAIPAVGLHPISGLARDERGGDDSAIMAQMGELPVDPIAAGAGLIAEGQDFPPGGLASSRVWPPPPGCWRSPWNNEAYFGPLRQWPRRSYLYVYLALYTWLHFVMTCPSIVALS